MIRRMVLVLLVVLVGWPMVGQVEAQSADCQTVMDNLGQPQVQLAAMSYSDALAWYACELEADPSNVVARIGRLQSALLAGEYLTAHGDVFLLNDGSFRVLDTAITAQTEILASNPDNVDAYQIRAFLYLFGGQPNLASIDAGKILTLEPGSFFAYLIQAGSSEMMGDTEGAASAFLRAVELSPDNPQLYGLMAAAQWSSFNIEGMAANSSRAIELAPDLAYLYRLHGMSQMVMRNPEGALADANRAIELDPTYYAYYILRANAHLALAGPRAAFADLSTAIEMNPRTEIGHGIRSNVALALGDHKTATQDFMTALDLGTLEIIEGAALVSGEPLTVAMTRGRTYRLSFEAHQGERIAIYITSVIPEEVDPLMVVIGPDGTPLAFNDDVSDETLDAHIVGLEIPTSGTYTLVVSHANAGSEGDIALSLAAYWPCCARGR